MAFTYSIVVLAVLACSLPIIAEGLGVKLASIRLPSSFQPNNYDIKIRPFLLESDGPKRFTFEGDVYINVTRMDDSKKLYLHSKNLNYTLTEYWNAETPMDKKRLVQTSFDSITDKMGFTLDGGPVGTAYILYFKYIGYMNDDMHGFYRSSYVEADNVKKWMGVTQLEPIYARRAFPSFDEPKFKAAFDVTIIRHKSMRSHSNTRLQKSLRDGDYYTDTYERTPVMSTYLLSFLISEFNERFDGNFGVISRPQYYDQTEYAFVLGKKILPVLENYVNIAYNTLGIDKLQMAAIPDFDAGAMENWGLLTYKENALLYDNKSTSLRAKQDIALTIAHEQVHMWFGNLVTCEWWSYIWLNEGFARYFEYFITAKVEKDLYLEQQFVVTVVQGAMTLDSTNATRVLNYVDLNIVTEEQYMLSNVPYAKAASVIHMMRHIIGEKYFRKSLQEYLATYKYKNVVPDNLLKIWEKHLPLNLKNLGSLTFKSFTEQVGYPVVTINVAGDGRSMTIEQNRFLLDPSDGSDDTLLYTIPLSYTTSEEKDFSATAPKFFLKASKEKRTERFRKRVSWVIANIQESGYYRVNYNRRNWLHIHRALLSPNWGDIHELNRAQIVNDLFSLALANVIRYDFALSILEYLVTERNYLPWSAAFQGLSSLHSRLGDTMPELNSYINQLLEEIYNQLGFDEKQNDSTFDIYNRANVLLWACKYGNEQCINEAKKRFSNLKSTPVPANIRYAVYCTSMRYGTEKDFDILFNQYETETAETARKLSLKAMGCVRSKALIKRYFKIIISEKVRRQDIISALYSLISGDVKNHVIVLDLVANYLGQLATALGGYDLVAPVIERIAARITEESEEMKLLHIFEENSYKFNATATSAQKIINKNYEWSRRNLHTIRGYLKKRANASGNISSSLKVLTMVFVPLCGIFLH